MNRILLCCLGFLTLNAFGQTDLSLSDAIIIGLEKNYDIRIQDKNVIVATNNNNWGETGYLPSVSFNLQSQNNVRNQISDNQFFSGQLFPGFELKDQRSYGLTPGVQVNWTFFRGFSAVISKHILEQMQAESMQNAEIVVSNTLQSIILGYYMAVLEKQRLDEFRKQLILSRDRYGYVKARYDIGGAVSTDLLLEETNYLTDSANFINQELSYHNAIRNLNVLLVADNLNTDYTLTDSLSTEFEDYTYESLEEAMLSDNMDLKKLYISQSILQNQVNRNRAERIPTATLNGGYNWNRNVSDLTSAEYKGPNADYQNPPDPLVNKTGTYFANFTLTFNLYNGGRVNRAIRNSVVDEDIGNIKIEQLRTSLTRNLMTAYEQYQIRKQLYTISDRRVQAASLNLEVSAEKFKNGSINSFDYRVVQNNYLTASTQRLQALYNLIDSKIELMRLTGGLVTENVQ